MNWANKKVCANKNRLDWRFLTGSLALLLANAAAGAGLTLPDSAYDTRPLFTAQAPVAPETDAEPAPATGNRFGVTGSLDAEIARTYASPSHWSRGLARLQLAKQGKFGDNVKYHISGRYDYDAAYDRGTFYPPDVRNDQRSEFQLRETYIDTSAGDWEFRLGRQHIVWGEMVGLFFADVVSPKDLREFILPDFGDLRIPQWAARAEYFKDDFHAELIWIPYASYNNIGKPGAEFYPYPPNARFIPVVLGDEQPAHSPNNSNYGLRLGTIKDGWDVSGFVYRSYDAAPILAFDPSIRAYRPQHDHITQVGGTLAKDFGSVVLKAEAVYTHGRRFYTNDLTPAAPTGLVDQNTLLYVAGLEFSLPGDINFNVQLFDNVFFNHDPSLFYSEHEAGTTMLLKRSMTNSVELQALFIRSLNRDDWMVRPSVKWGFEKNWNLTAGVDVFDGPPTGFFGQYRNRDRVYTDVRYSF